MIKRYIACTPPGVIVTAGLLLLMQQLISTGETVLIPGTYRMPTTFRSVELPPPPTPADTSRPPPPIPRPLPVPGGMPVLPDEVPINDTSIPIAPQPEPWKRPSGELPIWADSALVSLVRVEPKYPSRAINLALEGNVLVRFDVGMDGRVSNPVVVQTSHVVFNGAALQAVRQFRYKPRVVDGSPVATAGVQTVFRFEMEKQHQTL